MPMLLFALYLHSSASPKALGIEMRFQASNRQARARGKLETLALTALRALTCFHAPANRASDQA